MAEADTTHPRRELTSAELGALAHLYRGEIYRSTVWRTRLDTSTNWAVVTLGVALSITFSSPSASPLPLVLVGILVLLFLMLESRRYRYLSRCSRTATSIWNEAGMTCSPKTIGAHTTTLVS